ncbi:hypothetical protein EVAR_63850_1 [Eumeta japonica]|uniref:Uncharacterized protein n=1 Tax=Eumeta variegata TaxID=151549 RepID=A0A4C1Z4V6_EUMVA|nr:hypothetical protein EVAR_63850_1 [Eumeta japonica]
MNISFNNCRCRPTFSQIVKGGITSTSEFAVPETRNIQSYKVELYDQMPIVVSGNFVVDLCYSSGSGAGGARRRRGRLTGRAHATAAALSAPNRCLRCIKQFDSDYNLRVTPLSDGGA